MHFKNNLGIIIILGIFLSFNILFLNFHDFSWDSAVYIGMGKYIYSFWESGFWEPSRPLVLPIFLGFLWKLGFGITFQILFNTLFGVGCIYVVYLLGKEIFDKKTAIIASLFLAFSPTFFFFNTMILTGIPSTFFGLLAVYTIFKKKYFLVGLFSGLAFMTRFLQLWIFFILLFILFLKFFKEKSTVKNIIFMSGGFILAVFPYLVFNFIMYGSFLHPFLLQKWMTAYTGLIWHEPWWFYIINLFKESFVSVFSLIGLFFIFRRRGNKKLIISFILIVFFMFFTLVKHKETRFMVVFMPYLYLISSYGFLKAIKKIKNKQVVFSVIIVLILALAAQYSFQIMPSYQYGLEKENKFLEFQNYLDGKEVVGVVWISNPVFAVDSDYKIDNIMYYPTFNHDKFLSLKENLNAANHVLINTCDLGCESYNKFCEGDKAELISLLKIDFNEVFYKKEGYCESYIFQK